jgi:hypothetical protein
MKTRLLIHISLKYPFTGRVLLPILTLCLVSCQQPQEGKAGQVSAEPLHTVRLHPANPRYLEYAGEPLVLITSAEHYGAVVNLDFDYKKYLAELGKEGFNYSRIFSGTYIEPVENIFGIERNTLAPLPGRFISPWVKEGEKYDLERFNPDYFIRLKDFLRQAESHGIVVELSLFTSIYHESAWKLSPFHESNNLNGAGGIEFQMVNTLYNDRLKEYQERFVRKIVQEVNEFDNLFFEIQNEPWSDNGCLAGFVNQEDDSTFSRNWQKRVEVANGMAMEWQGWIASLIRDEESRLPKTHLIAQNICNYGYNIDSVPGGVSILNFHYAHPEAARDNLDLGITLSLDETGFMPHEDTLYLFQAWRFLLSGGGIYNNLDYSFVAGEEEGGWPVPDSNPGWGGPAFRRKLSILVETMAGIPYAGMEVSGSILEETGSGLKQYGLQKPGDTYLVFLESITGHKLVPVVPASVYRVTYIDIMEGEKKTVEISLGEGQVLDPPFRKESMALLIRKMD